MRIYLDHGATTPCDRRVVEAMQPYFDGQYGNPSSQYWLGQEASEAVEGAREKIAALIGADNDEVIFTSSGTESDNMAIKGVAWARRKQGNHIITSAIEHPAVLETCKWLVKQGFEITYISVDHDGLIKVDELQKAIKQETVLISVMQANNEVGTIQPIAEISQIARERGIYMHTDAVQAVGSIPIDVKELGVDLLSLSAHKLYGPKGVGALYVKSGVFLEPLLHGGHQEAKKRASTENVAGIVGFGKAAELAKAGMEVEAARLIKLRDKLIKGITDRIDEVELNGQAINRLSNNVNMSFSYVEGESLLMHLDAVGIACSTGSACQSTDLKASHVLLAMGLEHALAHGSLRFTLGRSTTEKEIDRVLEVLPGIVNKLRAMSPLAIDHQQKIYA